MTVSRLSRWHPQIAPPSSGDSPALESFAKRNLGVPPSAVLVFHGIGEEVRFETLSRAAAFLLQEAQDRGASNISVIIRSVPKDRAISSLETRAELSWTEKNGSPRQVHVYEAYWAPLTVGKVTYLESVRFLAAAGWNGLRGTVLSGKFGHFERWLFGDFKELRTTGGTLPLLVVLMVMIGFVAAIIAMAASAVAGVAKQFGTGGPRAFFNAVSFIYNQIVIPWNVIVEFVRHWCTALFGWSSAAGWLSHIEFASPLSRQHWLQGLLAIILWAGLIWAAFYVRFFLVQYAGSVVAYISPYKDSKFEELRNQIQKIGFDMGKLILDGHEFSKWIPEYQRIVYVAHSLGSVIGYDTLNAMFNIKAAALPHGAPNPAVNRTHALITFGSPLDKTAFLFRVQLESMRNRLDQHGELRETMVAAIQPLITSYPDYRFTPAHGPRWINLWSPRDIISGHLDYYDDPAVSQNAPEHVQNMRDPGAWIPIAAHVQYWDKPLLRRTVYDHLF